MKKKKHKSKFFKKKINQGNLIIGQIDGNSKGFAFLLHEKGDLFISRDNLHGARHGDMVRARKIADDAVEVVEIISRGTNTIVGTYYQSGKKGIVLPDNKHFPEVVISSGSANDGEKVLVTFLENGKGKIIEVLGKSGEVGVDLKSIIRSYGLFDTFPRAVIKNAKKVSKITPEDFIGREDFREDIVFTIDGADSRDFDDAVSIKKTSGGYILKVHIADVAHYVQAGSPLDKEAYNRGTSVYFPFAVLPMLPHELSNDICSLKQGQDRLTLSVIMHINKNGEVTKYKIVEGVINCFARLTYKQAQAIIDGDPDLIKEYKKLVLPLKNMHDLCILLLNKRKKRGAIDFESEEPQITMDGFKVVSVKESERLISHKIIEEFMVLTNSVIAKHFSELGIPFVYRVHTPPTHEKIYRFQEFLGTIGLTFDFLGDEPRPQDFANMLESIDKEIKPVVSAVMLRTMAKATYEAENKGHFGLSLKNYCHFTSPIRRYPDLLIHRIIKSSFKGESLKKYKGVVSDAARQSSIRERLAEEAERKVDDLLIAKYMSQFIGEDFEGIINGITEWGIFVRLKNTAEGLIRIEKLNGEYIFDERSMTLRGSNDYRLGQKITVTLIDVINDRIEFIPKN